jgi:hypothetical protein
VGRVGREAVLVGAPLSVFSWSERGEQDTVAGGQQRGPCIRTWHERMGEGHPALANMPGQAPDGGANGWPWGGVVGTGVIGD